MEKKMFNEFKLKNEKKNFELAGYEWSVENPKAVVCMVHGIGEHSGRYHRMAGYFNNANIAMVSVDLRGHGKTAGKRGHCAPRVNVLSDVDALVNYAKEKYGNVPIFVYGHSMGGNIVLDYRKRGQDADIPFGYIVSAPWIKLVQPIPDGLYKMVKGLSKVMSSFTIGSKVDEGILGNIKSVGKYKDDPLVHSKISMGCAIDGFDIGKQLEENTIEDNKKAQGKPFLLMHGTSDKLCSIEGTRNMVKAAGYEENPEFTYIEWPELYHEIHNGGAVSTGDEVILRVADWITAQVISAG